MEKIHENHVFMYFMYKTCMFYVFSPFSAYFSPHNIIAEKGPLKAARPLCFLMLIPCFHCSLASLVVCSGSLWILILSLIEAGSNKSTVEPLLKDTLK